MSNQPEFYRMGQGRDFFHGNQRTNNFNSNTTQFKSLTFVQFTSIPLKLQTSKIIYSYNCISSNSFLTRLSPISIDPVKFMIDFSRNKNHVNDPDQSFAKKCNSKYRMITMMMMMWGNIWYDYPSNIVKRRKNCCQKL